MNTYFIVLPKKAQVFIQNLFFQKILFWDAVAVEQVQSEDAHESKEDEKRDGTKNNKKRVRELLYATHFYMVAARSATGVSAARSATGASAARSATEASAEKSTTAAVTTTTTTTTPRGPTPCPTVTVDIDMHNGLFTAGVELERARSGVHLDCQWPALGHRRRHGGLPQD